MITKAAKLQSKDLAEIAGQSAEYAYDPLAWVMWAFPWGEGDLKGFDGPDVWQRKFLTDLTLEMERLTAEGGVIRMATASGKGPGKSAIVAWVILWCLSTYTDTKGVVTANTERQLKTKTWVELAKWHRLSITKDLLNRSAEKICFYGPEHTDTYRVDMAPWTLENTESFQGLHNVGKRLLCIFDEASAIDDEIWKVTEGSLTDPKTEIIWLAFGNPTRGTGRFRDCFPGGKFAKRWNSRQIDTRDCKFSNKTQIDEWLQDYGEDSDFFKYTVRGMFPSASAKQFISITDVDAAYNRFLRPEQYNFAPKILSVDPAWEGDDDLVIGIRQGLAFRILRVIPKNDNDFEIAALIAQHEDDESADAVFIDAGYGTGIVSAGRTMKRNWQLVWFAGESSDPGCFNKRAEIWNAMKKWLKEGGAIPPDMGLYADLIGPETVFRPDGKIQLESKKSMKSRGLPSPGRADCLAISFAYPVRTDGEYTLPVNDAAAQPSDEYEPLYDNW